MNEDHAYIHQEWHRAASMRDLPALLALYADDATFENPLVPAVLNDKSDGVLRGKAEIAHFLETGARSRPVDLVRWYLPDIAVTPPDEPMDFCAWFEAYLGDRWWTFDGRINVPRIGRVVIGRGRDAVDVAMVTAYGPVEFKGLTVWADEVVPSGV